MLNLDHLQPEKRRGIEALMAELAVAIDEIAAERALERRLARPPLPPMQASPRQLPPVTEDQEP